MEITDKINYVLGKTVVYMLLIIYPFVMHNKLNDVTLTRFFFFIIVSYVVFLVLCINSLASFILKRVSDKKKYDDDKADLINIQEGAYSAESQSISKVYDIKDKIKNMDLWKKSYLYVQTLWQLPHKKHRQHPYVPEMMQLPAEK